MVGGVSALMKTFVAVIGGENCTAEVGRLAEQVGRLLAERGVVLVCGGRGGVMEAACRGAKAAGGLTVGILPGDDRSQSNAYVDIPVVTGLGWARNAVVVKTAQAAIALDGKYGTLSEIACALQEGIPVVGVGTWTLVREGVVDDLMMVAETPADAVEKALSAIAWRSGKWSGRFSEKR
jgi:uncharacterized protein (TIGR00725 family)